jgi:hypothetical protein
MGKRAIRIGIQQGGEAGGCVGSVGEIARDEMIESGTSLRTGNADRKTAGIEMHGDVGIRHTPMPDPFEHLASMILPSTAGDTDRPARTPSRRERY